MKPICVPCQKFYRCIKSGYSFIEAMPTINTAEPGTIDPHLWKPYKLWMGDLWECLGCHHQVVSGVGANPISEHYENNFEDSVKTFDPQLQVNDC